MSAPKPTLSFDRLLAPIVIRGKAPRASAETARFLPWLAEAKQVSPELVRWNEVLSVTKVRGGYRNPLFAAATTTFTRALTVSDDGCRAARIRGMFLGASPILEDAEELWFATWAPTAQGTSQVWATHQDERELELLDDSIASFVLRQYRDDSYFNDAEDAETRVVLPPELARLTPTKPKSKLPSGLSPADMEPRTDWIVALFFPEADWYGIGDGLDDAPPFAAFAQEKQLALTWPHYQAYWLLHHLVFENHKALAALLPHVNDAYAPAAELATFAKAALAGKSIPSKEWKEKRLLGLRTIARDKRPDVFEKPEGATTRKKIASVEDAVAAARHALEHAADHDPSMVEPLETFAALESGAGQLAAFEGALIKEWFPKDLERQVETFVLSKRGNAPALQHLLRALALGADARWLPLASALVRRGARFDEDHVKVFPGALTAMGIAIGDFQRFSAQVKEVLGPPKSLGRVRRLEMAVAAEQLVRSKKDAKGAALAFLRSEAKRFADQIDEWETDTAAAPLGFLLRERDPHAIALLERMMSKAEFSGANWKSLMGIVRLVHNEIASPVFVTALDHALSRELGRHDDGERALIATTMAKCSPTKAKVILQKKLTRTGEGAEQAALLAGLVTAAPNDAAVAKRALPLLGALDPKDSLECGAAIALLRAAIEAKAKGFGPMLKRWQQAKKTPHANKSLVAWLKSASA